MGTPSFAEIQKFNPARSVSWRWERARWLVSKRRRFSHSHDDETTERAVRYLRERARGRSANLGSVVRKHFQDIHLACQLHENGGASQLLVEARILARQTSAEIGLLTSVPPEVVSAYEALFFQVRDRLDARDWITVRVIGLGMSQQPDPAAVFKLFAYLGGPMVLESAAPFLVEGKDLFDPPPHLGTPEGRQDQVVRLAIATMLLPDDAATNKKLHRLMLIESERRRPVQCAPADLLAQNVDSWFREALADSPAERPVREAYPFPGEMLAVLGQIA